MRRVTRNFLVLMLAVLVALLALGALPGLLKTGNPYYLTAEPVNGSALDGERAGAAVNVTDLSERRFPYTTEALRNGTSDPYWKGPWGLKEGFTHSPFDEMGALSGRNATATTDDGVLVSDNGTLYRVAVRQRV
ncbi:MAG: hypothetical protein V5A44_00105 [Haloarculaceae archaeon]